MPSPDDKKEPRSPEDVSSRPGVLAEFLDVDLAAEVQRMLLQIPRGRITTYGALSRGLGDDKTRSARWLGDYLHHHPHTGECPCHRVVRVGGEIGLHVSGSPQQKAALLKQEGVIVSSQGKVDVTHPFTRFISTRPLQRLRDFQLELRKQFRSVPLKKRVRTVAGVDVAYRGDGTAYAAYVLLDFPNLSVVHELSLSMPVSFPYIPGYLTFRELPPMLAICEQAREQQLLGDVLFCDGNGQLHPWRAGIATCLGVLLNHPTIGIGKSLLCGTIRKSEPDSSLELVCDGEDVIGEVISASPSSRPVYVSAGNRITLEDASRLARQSFSRHRIPEPIFLADRNSKRLKK